MKTVVLITKDSQYRKVPLYEEVESIPASSAVGDLAITKFHNKVILYTQDGWKQLAKAQQLSKNTWVALEEVCPLCKK